MNHHLVTFLGKSRYDENTGYLRARYQFPDEREPVETAFFGLALARHLSVKAIIILGTRGSQWSVLVENLAREGEEEDTREEDTRIELLDAERQETVTQAMLDCVAPIMKQAVGIPVTPCLISRGDDADKQYKILSAIADAVRTGDVSFDLTHGFQHLGMIGFLSAFMLERVRNLNVRGLWYGALDMTDRGITPVLKLDGLTRVRRWVDALDRFDATGDYGVFAPLLIEDGVAKDRVACLEKAAFHERTLNVRDAVRQLGTFLPVLDEPLDGASGLFQKRLAERLSWVRQTGLARYQRKLAYESLKRQDFMRAAVFGWEALVTMECNCRGLPSDDFGAGRKLAIDALDVEIREGEHPKWKVRSFRTLKTIRNALAHGNPPDGAHYRDILRDPDRLYVELEKAFQRLLK